jgi:sulfite reductase (ferredoxin)
MLFTRELKALPLDHAGLDGAMLRKPGALPLRQASPVIPGFGQSLASKTFSGQAPRSQMAYATPPKRQDWTDALIVQAATAPEKTEESAETLFPDLSPGQIYGPTNPAHAWPKPWTNLYKQEKVQEVKAFSEQLKEPLMTEIANDEIFITGDAVHIMKHHGSYMQQNRMLKGIERKESYQFMLRLKMPCGEMPGPLFAQLDDLCDKYGQGDLRATTRQAFQLHGVLKNNLKTVIAAITNMGAGTLGGCGDISRNVMVPPVHFPHKKDYCYAQQYGRALADLFKPTASTFSELWLDGKKAMETEYWQRDIQEFNLDEVRVEDRGNGVITGHPTEPLYGRTYLPKKFKIAVVVPGDNGVDVYINDIGCVVIMSEDGETLEGFNIMVGGGLGRTHKNEITVPYAAKHLGYVNKDDFFEAMKAILAVQRDHGNREARNQARLKYLVNTLGIDDFRTLTEKYFGQKFEPWRKLKPFKYIDWMGWHDQGDGKLQLGVNIEQGRVRDVGDLKLKAALRKVVDTFPGVDLLLTPSQSVVLRGIEPADKENMEVLLKSHGVKMIEDIDPITRRSIACPAFPLCGLAMTEAERIQPTINKRIWALLNKMGLEDTHLVTRTTGCPNGCARPYMAELGLVGSGPQQYQLWLGGSPAQAERTAFESHLFKMKLDKMEETLEPIFEMYKTNRTMADKATANGWTSKGYEAFGDFCWRIGKDAIQAHCLQHEAVLKAKAEEAKQKAKAEQEEKKKAEAGASA